MSSQQRRSLLPVPVDTTSKSQQIRRGDQEETVPHRKGAALQLDQFNLFVGRVLVCLGITGNIIEIFTSSKAMLLRILDNPGPQDIGYNPKLGLSIFFACVFQAAMWTMVVNLNDSWVSILEGNYKQAFVSKGEVSLHLILLMIFTFGGASINAICDVIFLSDVTTDPLVISLGTAALVMSSILLWPLGWKLVRHARIRIQTAKAAARAMAAATTQQLTSGNPQVVPGTLIHSNNQNSRH